MNHDDRAQMSIFLSGTLIHKPGIYIHEYVLIVLEKYALAPLPIIKKAFGMHQSSSQSCISAGIYHTMVSYIHIYQDTRYASYIACLYWYIALLRGGQIANRRPVIIFW